MGRITVDDPNKVAACPECDSTTGVYERDPDGRGQPYRGDPKARCVCYGCGATFEKPVIRKRQTHGATAGHGIDPEMKALVERLRGGD